MDAVRIEFVRGEARRYRSLIHRTDGVVLEFDGGSYNQVGGPARELPHDLAHLIVEDELALTAGVWGIVCSGGLFRHTKVIAGRQAPHATERGRALAAGAHGSIMQAEALTRAVADWCLAGGPPDPAALRRAIAEADWTEAATPERLGQIRGRLWAASEAWAALAPGEALTEHWPHPALPQGPRGRRR